MKEFIENIAKQLVDHPDSVAVTEVEGEKTTVYELRVNAEDSLYLSMDYNNNDAYKWIDPSDTGCHNGHPSQNYTN